MSEENEMICVGMDTQKGFELLQRQANMFAASKMVPSIYQKNPADCAIALDIAYRMKANPLMVMQNLYIVHGTPGWSAKFLIATINLSGRFSTLEYEREGDNPKDDNYRVRAYAENLKTGQTLYGEWIDWKMVKEEGWLNKNGSKWKTMPGQMFVYRSASFWQRAYCPEIGMGFMTVEEVEDFSGVAQRVDQAAPTPQEGRKLAAYRPVQSLEQQAHQPMPSVDYTTGEVLESEPVQQAQAKPAAHRASFDPTPYEEEEVGFDEPAAAYKAAKGE